MFENIFVDKWIKIKYTSLIYRNKDNANMATLDIQKKYIVIVKI